ncbi:hypothetical protein JAO71_05105 [Olleya sp. YSTF-M6]|uniref:Uncharacterized protein n=1 Tax=Olleya sediminilitoris TaxID=2795739 RepID=A0ABS1WJ75_9FLAO|nr:hypothetical protein [Olleya sediminilitoris]MBL7559177.1 hypothetical protein [Olleya sediminilitoris]
MKAKLIIIAIAFLSLTSFVSNNTMAVTGVYKGVVEYDYVFHINETDRSMTFQYLSDEALEAFDLDSEEFVGSKFEVTYEVLQEMSEDTEGNEVEIEIYTITALELID